MGDDPKHIAAEPEHKSDQLYAETKFNNVLSSCFFKKVTNTAQLVPLNICLFLRKASHNSSCKYCRFLQQLPNKTSSMNLTLSMNLKAALCTEEWESSQACAGFTSYGGGPYL